MKDFGLVLAIFAGVLWAGGLLGSLVSEEFFTTPVAARELAYSLALVAMAIGVCGREE